MTKEELRNIRIEAIKLLYEYHLVPGEISSIINLKQDLKEEALDLFTKVMKLIPELDEIISLNLEKYTIKRLNLVDLAIIELATYELKYTDIPKAVIINEALEISKVYTYTDDFDSVKFNNKVLDKIAKYLNK